MSGPIHNGWGEIKLRHLRGNCAVNIPTVCLINADLSHHLSLARTEYEKKEGMALHIHYMCLEIGRNSTAGLRCLVVDMALDAPMISCQIPSFFQAQFITHTHRSWLLGLAHS